MTKQFKSVSMMLCLLAMSTGPAIATTGDAEVAIPVVQQSETCTGVVKDAAGETVIGASVIVQGTTNGTITDFDGNFTLTNVKKGDVIEISFVGYVTQTVTFNGQPLNIILKDDTQQLEEVVVTGYGGSQKRAALTTAISKVDDGVLKNAAFSNAGQALQGSVTGLRVINTSGAPGSTPTITLRGGATISGTNNALVIVDGIIRNSMADVNPEDIASMQVLKDAASTAIYGARANGGVILIETKSGKKGKAQVNYKFKMGFNAQRTGYDFLNTEDYIYYNRLGMKRTDNAQSGYSGPRTPDGQQGYGANYSDLFELKYLTAETEGLKAKGWKVMDDPYYEGKQLIYNDHAGVLEDAMFRTGVLQEHYLNFSGGNENGAFMASVGYYDEDGMAYGTSYRRFTGNVSGNYQVLPFLKVKASANLMWSTKPGLWTSEFNFFYRTRSQRPTWNPYNEDGTPASGFGQSDGNAEYWLDKYVAKNSTQRTTFSGGFTADIIKDHLVLDANASLLNYQYQNEYFWKAFQQQNAGANTSRNANNEIEKYNQIQTNATLTYKNVFDDVHDLNVMIGGEYYTYDWYEFYANVHGAPTDDIPTLNVAPDYDKVSSEKSAYRILSAFGRVEYNYDMKYLLALTGRYDGISRLADNRWGFFPGISAGWNVTREAFWEESKLADVITTLKPRVSFGTNGNVSGLGNYEVYGIYGTTTMYNGSTSIVNTGLLNTGLRWEQSQTFEVGLDVGLWNNKLSFIFDYYNRETKDLLTNLSLPGYTGFNSIRTNLGNLRNSGFEMEVRANLINKGGFTWDMTANLTTVSNKILKLPSNSNERNRVGGFEVAAGPATQQADGTWKYNTKWVGGTQEGGRLDDMVAYVQQHIFRDWDDVKQHANTRIDQVGKLYGPGLADQINPATGKTYKTSSGWKPIEPGDVCWEDMDGDGQITTYDQKVVGNYLPNVTGGFSSTWAYKGLSLYTRFDFALGHTLYNEFLCRSIGQYQGSFNMVDVVKDMWSEDNRDTDLPAFYYADQLAKYNITRGNNASYSYNGANSRFYENGNYLACREITLSYQLPKSLVNKCFIQDASVYVTGQNLFYITNYSGVSPEPAVSGAVQVGSDTGRYPTPRTFLFGLSLTF